jgi:hypothetical protein
MRCLGCYDSCGQASDGHRHMDLTTWIATRRISDSNSSKQD